MGVISEWASFPRHWCASAASAKNRQSGSYDLGGKRNILGIFGLNRSILCFSWSKMPLAQLADPWRKMNTTPVSEVGKNTQEFLVLNRPVYVAWSVIVAWHDVVFVVWLAFYSIFQAGDDAMADECNNEVLHYSPFRRLRVFMLHWGGLFGRCTRALNNVLASYSITGEVARRTLIGAWYVGSFGEDENLSKGWTISLWTTESPGPRVVRKSKFKLGVDLDDF